MDVAARLEVVERENEALRERVAALEAVLTGDMLPPIQFGLSPSEGRILAMFLNRRFITRDAIMALLYRDLGRDEPELKIVDVFVCKLRKKVKPFGVEILTRWGQGYEMPEASKRIIRELMGDLGAAA